MMHRVFIAVCITILAVGVANSQKSTKQKGKTTAKPAAAPSSAAKPAATTQQQLGADTDPSKCSSANGLSRAEIDELLAAHNAARADKQLPALTWSCKLAQLAQEWADKSIYEHRENFSFGENIFVSASPGEPVGSVVSRWMLEKPNWNNQNAACADGKNCVHYVQMMWRATTRLGCGINRKATGKWRSVTVCNYDPGSRSSGPAW